jgi:hypothetical protein
MEKTRGKGYQVLSHEGLQRPMVQTMKDIQEEI